MDGYVERLIREIKSFKGLKADTVYIGGGTPTVLSSENLLEIVKTLYDEFDIDENAEFTIESNPATADALKYKALVDAGVNRISIGVQSFHDDELSALSRIHSGKEAKKAVLDAKEAGFKNISIDLMEGIPKQTIKSFAESLETALSLDVDHISVYSLIIEEGTSFYKNTPELPDEDEDREMYRYAIDALKAHGYQHYEISNFAKPGCKSRHNTKYWTREPYYGFGAGAHSFYNNKRYENVHGVEEYIKSESAVESVIDITRAEAENEVFMLGFRMLEGFDTKGLFKDKLKKLLKEGLIEIEGDKARLSSYGLDFANRVFVEFIGD